MIALSAKQRAILTEVGLRTGNGLSSNYRQNGWPWQTMHFLERHGLVQCGHAYRVEQWLKVDGIDTTVNHYGHHWLVRITDKGRDVLRLR
jgi:hypothetical protein